MQTLLNKIKHFIEKETRRLIQDGNKDNDAGFNALALELFEFQYHHVPPYQTWCRTKRVRPGGIAHWKEIPALPATAFKEYAITCLSSEDRTRAFHSSGTTEQTRGTHFHDANSLALYEASLLPWFQWHFMEPPQAESKACAFLSLSPSREEAPQSSLAHMLHTIANRLCASASTFAGRVLKDGSWTVDFSKAAPAIERAVRTNQPLIVAGTAFNYVHLLDHCAQTQETLELPAGSRLMETGGYKGKSRELKKQELYKDLTRLFRLPGSSIIGEYGMCELSSQAYDRRFVGASEPPRVFKFPPWARVQILSPETGDPVNEGEAGLIRILDLANAASVQAIQTGDLGILRPEGFELLGRNPADELKGCSLMSP